MKAFIKLFILFSASFYSGCHCAESLVNSAPSRNVPDGLWGWHYQDYQTRLDVTIARENQKWLAKTGTEKRAVNFHNNKLSFSLENGQRFEGHVSEAGKIEGTWFQPASSYGYYSDIITFVVLESIKANRWKGAIPLQPRPFHILVEFFKDEEGGDKAALRNPERNDTLGVTQFDVTHINGARWKLSATRGGRQIEVPFQYTEDEEIVLDYPLLSEPITLKPATADMASKYFSRRKTTKRYAYQTPVKLDDGWDIADASSAGFDRGTLNDLIHKYATTSPRTPSPQLLHSLLVSYKSELVIEEYFYGHSAEDVHDLRSLAKVFGSVMIGAAQQQGIAISPATTYPLNSVFSQHNLPLPKDKSSIALEYFLTYTSGLDTAENQSSPGSEDRLWAQEGDFWLYTANLPVEHSPGVRYAYSSASANIVGAALEAKTGEAVSEFFHRTIAEPLQMSTYHWNLTPNGRNYLGGGVYMRPRDVLKIGAVYAANGRWQGKQIIPEQWVALSTAKKIDISPETTGLKDTEFSNTYFGGKQAFIWRVSEVQTEGRTYKSYEATGNGGQTLIVVPELELAAVTTGGNYRMGRIWGKWRQQIMGNYIIPALVKRQG